MVPVNEFTFSLKSFTKPPMQSIRANYVKSLDENSVFYFEPLNRFRVWNKVTIAGINAHHGQWANVKFAAS